MFCFAIVDGNTGDIKYCFVDNGSDLDFKSAIAEGVYPISISKLPPGWYYTIIEQEDLIDALADPKVERFVNDRQLIAREIHKSKNATFDASRIREELKIHSKNKEDKKELRECILEVRSSRARIDPVKGLITREEPNNG